MTMKRFAIIIAVALGLSSCATQCCWCETLYHQIENILNDEPTDYNLEVVLPHYISVQDKMDYLMNSTDKWDVYEYECLELYARILTDLDYKEAYYEMIGNTEASEYCFNAYYEVARIFECHEKAYDGVEHVISYLAFNLEEYRFFELEDTEEYKNYSKWVYAKWFGGCIKTLKHK